MTRKLDKHPVAALAGRQHGVVSRAQLRALGLSANAIDARVANGTLLRVYRGVYAVTCGSISAGSSRATGVAATSRAARARVPPSRSGCWPSADASICRGPR